MTTLTEFLDQHCQSAAECFKKQGDFKPMWIVETKLQGNLCICTPWENDDDKDKIVNSLKQLFEMFQAQRYAFITEAWIVSTKDGKLPESHRLGASLASHPDRREVLMVTVEDRKSTMMRMFYILRPEHGPVTLSPFNEMDCDKSKGRFVNLLPKDGENEQDRE